MTCKNMVRRAERRAWCFTLQPSPLSVWLSVSHFVFWWLCRRCLVSTFVFRSNLNRILLFVAVLRLYSFLSVSLAVTRLLTHVLLILTIMHTWPSPSSPLLLYLSLLLFFSRCIPRHLSSPCLFLFLTVSPYTPRYRLSLPLFISVSYTYSVSPYTPRHCLSLCLCPSHCLPVHASPSFVSLSLSLSRLPLPPFKGRTSSSSVSRGALLSTTGRAANGSGTFDGVIASTKCGAGNHARAAANASVLPLEVVSAAEPVAAPFWPAVSSAHCARLARPCARIRAARSCRITWEVKKEVTVNTNEAQFGAATTTGINARANCGRRLSSCWFYGRKTRCRRRERETGKTRCP